jgi:hypothetical protein
MNAISRAFLPIAALFLLLSAGPASAQIFRLDGTFYVDLVRGPDIEGLIHHGDPVSVEAFYDTSQATLLPGGTPTSTSYLFPADAAGIRFTVDGLEWRTTGPMTIGVVPMEMGVNHSDGSLAASWGGPAWLGYTDPTQGGFGTVTTLQTPFGAESGSGKWMLYLPQFPTEMVTPGVLPTNLTLNQLGGPNFVHGAAAGAGPGGDYFFNFTSPVPEPSTLVLMLAGLGLLFLSKRQPGAAWRRSYGMTPQA